MTEEMVWVELCRDQGLPYEKYIEQPLWFIEAHMIRLMSGAGK